MQSFRRSVPFLLGSAMAWTATNGCSGGSASNPGDTAADAGRIGLDLQIGSTTLDVVDYAITGPSPFSKSGSINVGQSSTVSAVIGGLPAGAGFSITLSGTAANGSTTCAGSAQFNVTAGQTTPVAVHLVCHEGPLAGSIIINGTIDVCPVIDGVTATPGSVRVGNTIALSASAHDSDHGPSPLSYSWTTTSGTLSSASSPNPTFSCTTAGTATLSLTVSDGDATAGCPASTTLSVTCNAAPQLAEVGHIVVIYQENHSFDNLFGSYPGAEGLSSPSANIPQIDNTTGLPYALLPQVDPNIPATLPNTPFDITRFVPANQLTVDLVHRFYQEQAQIDLGKMDKFVTVSDAKGLSFGFYPTPAVPIVSLMNSMPDQVALCDHFFHAAFGGSFLNHQWLIAAASPVFPNAPTGIVATVDAQGNLLTDGQVTPDGFVVNTSYSVNAPHPATTAVANLVPNQTNPTIGDRLSDAGVDWAWYAGGYNDALAGHPDPLYQFHHQPFVYYSSFADGTAAKAAHLKDENDFTAGIAAGNLPPVSFVKLLGANNEHPGYADLVTGENHVVGLIKSLIASPLWSDTVVIVTYDENGGFWDHVPPPAVDHWGPGSRVPAIIFSPFAKAGVDSTSYDTTAILKLIERRFNLPALTSRDAAQADLASHALSFDPAIDGSDAGTSGAGGSGGAGGASGGAGTGDSETGGAGGGSGGSSGADAGAASGDASASPSKADIQTILNDHCIACHAGPGAPRGLDLTNVAVVVGAAAGECSLKSRIAAGNAQQSYLVDKIIGHAQDGGCFAGARMPAGGPYLADSDIATIAAWINAGAQ